MKMMQKIFCPFFNCVVYCLMNITLDFTFCLCPKENYITFYDIIFIITFVCAKEVWHNREREVLIRGSHTAFNFHQLKAFSKSLRV